MPGSFKIGEIWRYPVKSMGGEKLEASEITPNGLPFDRAWAVRDADGTIYSARKLGRLLQYSARYVEQDSDGPAPRAEVTFPDGKRMTSDDLALNAALSEDLGTEVTLSAVRPASDDAYYRKGELAKGGLDARTAFGLKPDEPLPDVFDVTGRLRKYVDNWGTYWSQPGTHFDTAPLHILSEASLRYLAMRNPDVVVDVRRFRPNIVVADAAGLSSPFEFDWVGQILSIGKAQVEVFWETVRCIMTTREQHDLPRGAKLMRTMVRETQQNCGVYAEIKQPGRVGIGDPISVGE